MDTTKLYCKGCQNSRTLARFTEGFKTCNTCRAKQSRRYYNNWSSPTPVHCLTICLASPKGSCFLRGVTYIYIYIHTCLKNLSRFSRALEMGWGRCEYYNCGSKKEMMIAFWKTCKKLYFASSLRVNHGISSHRSTSASIGAARCGAVRGLVEAKGYPRVRPHYS